MFNGIYRKGPQTGNFDDKKMKKRIISALIIAVLVVFALIIVFTSYYTVLDKEAAVVTTFGSVTDITEAGMHFKLPFGIQKVEKVNIGSIHKIELGYRTNQDGSTTAVENESQMITGDFNIVNVDFFIEYKITNPENYLFSSNKPEEVLKMLTQSQIRNVIGSSDVDFVLTTGKGSIETAVKDLILAELEDYDIGITLYSIKIQDGEPPTEKVRAAFRAVETAKQDSETAINNAKAYQEQKLPEARAQGNKLVQESEFYKRNRINQAKEEIAMFEAIYAQYSLNPDMTRTRMYYETIEKVLPGMKIYIDTTESGVSKLLPLESLIKEG